MITVITINKWNIGAELTFRDHVAPLEMKRAPSGSGHIARRALLKYYNN
jgi:hypothetical protein